VYLQKDEDVRVLDEEGFYLAASKYNYSDELIEKCRKNVLEAIELVKHWEFRGIGYCGLWLK
jgi:protein associated with RNAse G/E